MSNLLSPAPNRPGHSNASLNRGAGLTTRAVWVGLLCLSAVCGFGQKDPGPVAAVPDPATAERQGRALADELLNRRPEQELTRSAILKVRPPNQDWRETPVRVTVSLTPTNWTTCYEAAGPSQAVPPTRLVVSYQPGGPNHYELREAAATNTPPKVLAGNQTMIPFAGSDFWVADLGLEFLHWPTQRLLRKEIRRGQSCNVLESINPHPAPGAYSRVVCWIDVDTGGIVHADAFDVDGQLLKRFAPKSFEKISGRWELQEMEIRNARTRSVSRIEFNLSTP
ncbi:MAG TPA: outer membrane lipoprotein-sorting protein [Candidatus Paceibacterota bacterium]|nr:outer membrane lipoprotein-sorting protein [Candidatus Paceibacterota bacterium]